MMKNCIIITKLSISELTKAKTATYGRQSIVSRNDDADDEEVSAQLQRLQGNRSVLSSYHRPYQSSTRRNNRNNEDSSDSSDDDSIVITKTKKKKKSSLKRPSRSGGGRGRGNTYNDLVDTSDEEDQLEDTSDEEVSDVDDEDYVPTSKKSKPKKKRKILRKVSM